MLSSFSGERDEDTLWLFTFLPQEDRRREELKEAKHEAAWLKSLEIWKKRKVGNQCFLANKVSRMLLNSLMFSVKTVSAVINASR